MLSVPMNGCARIDIALISVKGNNATKMILNKLFTNAARRFAGSAWRQVPNTSDIPAMIISFCGDCELLLLSRNAVPMMMNAKKHSNLKTRSIRFLVNLTISYYLLWLVVPYSFASLSDTYSKMSPGWQSKTSQIFERVSKRIPLLCQF